MPRIYDRARTSGRCSQPGRHQRSRGEEEHLERSLLADCRSWRGKAICAEIHIESAFTQLHESTGFSLVLQSLTDIVAEQGRQSSHECRGSHSDPVFSCMVQERIASLGAAIRSLPGGPVTEHLRLRGLFHRGDCKKGTCAERAVSKGLNRVLKQQVHMICGGIEEPGRAGDRRRFAVADGSLHGCEEIVTSLSHGADQLQRVLYTPYALFAG